MAPLSPELSPQVMAWTAELRAQFAALGMSISLFCRLHPIDKGTVSRYLNGKRVPADRWLLDQIVALRASEGRPITDEVRQHLVNLQMGALKIAHPHEYRVRRVTDQLEIAVTSWREAERYADTLERKLSDRKRRTQDLIGETDRIRAAWDEDRIRYHRETAYLAEQLKIARDRADEAEHRVQVLEGLLDEMETQLPSREGLESHFDYHDPRAIAGLLDSFRRVGALEEIASITQRIPYYPLDLTNPYDVAGLLDALRRVDANEQIATLIGRLSDLQVHSPYTMIKLLDVFRRVDAKQQIASLIERVPDLNIREMDAYTVVALMDALRRVGAWRQVDFVSQHIPQLQLESWHTVVKLLDALRRARADDQLVQLTVRIVDLPLSLESALDTADLLDALGKIGAHELIARLIKQIPERLNGGPGTIARLLGVLCEVNAPDTIRKLAKKVATNTPVDNPYLVRGILDCFQWAGADVHFHALADRAAHGTPLDRVEDVEDLLRVIEEGNANEPAKVLAVRIAQAERMRHPSSQNPRSLNGGSD